MKLIILDYFRRWWLALAAIFIAYVVFQVISIRDTNSQTASEGVEATVNHTVAFVHNIYVFQVVMWLGFLSMFDLQRGGVRTLGHFTVDRETNWTRIVAGVSSFAGAGASSYRFFNVFYFSPRNKPNDLF